MVRNSDRRGVDSAPSPAGRASATFSRRLAQQLTVILGLKYFELTYDICELNFTRCAMLLSISITIIHIIDSPYTQRFSRFDITNLPKFAGNDYVHFLESRSACSCSHPEM